MTKSKFLHGSIYEAIAGFFQKGHPRSLLAKKNIVASLAIKGLNLCISLVLLPLTIGYVDASCYGIWLTISSIVAWFGFFDIGLTQGMRNKFAEAKARGDNHLAQAYVSTTYVLLSLISLGMWVIFMIVNPFLDWARILHVEASIQQDISVLAIVVFTYFCLTFVLKIVTTILLADQHPARSSLIDLGGQVFSLIFILLLVHFTRGSLLNLGLALCLSPLLVMVGATIFFFRGDYKPYRPQWSKADFRYSRQLFGLGIIFFIIQLANILQFQTANIIIARNFGTADVTSYNIVYKYFGVLNMLFVIFLAPFWSASTEAYQKNDIQWIKNAIRKYNLLNILLVGVGIIMLVFSETVYRFWLGEGRVTIGFWLSFSGFLFFNTSVFGGKYVSFLNGISALRLQFIACLISPFLYFLLAYVFIYHLRMGVASLFAASIITNFNTFLLAPIQYHQIMKGKKGIWIK